MAGTALTVFEEAAGRPQLALAELPALPLEELLPLVPGLRPELELTVEDDMVAARLRGGGELVRLFPATPDNTLIFNLIDGRTSLGQVAEAAAAAAGWSPEQAAAATRELFLQLVAAGACTPINSGPL
jgi:hypothetical protein